MLLLNLKVYECIVSFTDSIFLLLELLVALELLTKQISNTNHNMNYHLARNSVRRHLQPQKCPKELSESDTAMSSRACFVTCGLNELACW